MANSTTNRFARRLRRAASGSTLTVLLLAGVAPVVHADGPQALTSFASAQDSQPPQPWRFTTLPNKAATRFEVVQEDGKRVLRVEASQSYGNLVHPTQAPLNSGTTLAWRWRVDEFVQGADLRTRAGDDGAAKLCVFFDFPADRLPVGERTRLALARKATGEDVPSEALCYVWDHKEAKGSEFVNAFTRRVRKYSAPEG